MTSPDNKVPQEQQPEADQQPEVTAALVEMYNRKAVKLPADPWVKAEEAAKAETEALDDLYNN